MPLPSRTSLPAPPADPAATGTDGTHSNGQNGSRTRTRKTPAPAGAQSDPASTGEPPVTGFGGLDVSDYV